MRLAYAKYLIKRAMGETVETLRSERKRCPSDASLFADDPKCVSGYTRKGHHSTHFGETTDSKQTNPSTGGLGTGSNSGDGAGGGGNGGGGNGGGGL